MRQEKDFWTDRRIKVASDKWKGGENANEIAFDFGIRKSLVASLINRRPDMFPTRLKDRERGAA